MWYVGGVCGWCVCVCVGGVCVEWVRQSTFKERADTPLAGMLTSKGLQLFSIFRDRYSFLCLISGSESVFRLHIT